MIENFERLKKNVKILLIDDDLDYIQVTAFFLKSKGYNVDIATNGIDAVEKVKKGNVHIVLLDYYMPGLTGEDVVSKIREFNNKIIIILQTGFSGQQPPEDTLMRLDIQNYHDKANGPDKLLLQVLSAVRIFDQQNKVAMSGYRLKVIARLMNSIAEDLKSPIMSLGVGLEATQVLVNNAKELDKTIIDKISKIHNINKACLNTINNVMSLLISQSSEGDEGTKVKNEIEFVNMIRDLTAGELRTKSMSLEVTERSDDKELDYIAGNIKDIVFILCELIHQIVIVSQDSSSIKLEITNDKDAYYISLENEAISQISESDVFVLKSIITGMPSISLETIGSRYIIKIKKF